MKTWTPTYRVEVKTTGATLDPFAWKADVYGRANARNLAEFVARYNASFAPGGINHRADLAQVVINKATLVHQASGRVVAEVSA